MKWKSKCIYSMTSEYMDTAQSWNAESELKELITDSCRNCSYLTVIAVLNLSRSLSGEQTFSYTHTRVAK